MILRSLVEYYDRLKADQSVEIALLGFSEQKVAFCMLLNEDGSLHQIEDLCAREGKKVIPKAMIVPGGTKPRTSGVSPGFIWDNTVYMLGVKPDDLKPQRTRECFEAFRQLHLEAEREIDDPEYAAVCRFLENWQPEQASDHPILRELHSGFGVFRIRGRQHYVHERQPVAEYALRRRGQEADQLIGQCLVTGERGPLARLHGPKIKGVAGAQPSGAPLVSFNRDAFTSYGKEKSYNAPVSQGAAFRYATALNHLLRPGSTQRVQIGDATTVFWTDRPSRAEVVFGQVIGSTKAEDEATRQQVESILKRLSRGQYADELGEPDTAFYVLGLSSNASRLSVRFWHVSTLEELCGRLHQHFADLAIMRSPRDPEFPALWQILAQTARESKDITPLLSGALIRSILTGTAYPEALYTAVIRRIRADRQVNYVRAAVIKACLTRKARLNPQYQMKEITMPFDPDRPEPAYHLGRLFAALEKAQEEALGRGLNATIKDRYFGAASATPASVFPRLNRLSQHHLAKLEPGPRVGHNKRIQEIVGHLDDFPAHLNLHDQGLFAIGYYHQRQHMFTRTSN